MNRELAQLVEIPDSRQRNRWFGKDVSECLERFEASATRTQQKVDWNKVLGLTTVLLVVTLGWTAIGIAILRFLR